MKKRSKARQIRIGTRGSALALAQTNELCKRLASIHGSELSFDIRVIKTSGDKIQDRALLALGGKGLFTKELEEGLLDNSLDIAVHSMKDMQAVLPKGLTIGCLLPREDVRDALICLKAPSLLELPEGAVVGTASIRREAFLRHIRPDLRIVLFRGNVQTRLQKLEHGEADATLLAVAGLRRLGLENRITQVISTDEMLPAPAQGAIGVELREDDLEMREILAPIHDEATAIAVGAEREFLRELDGSCRTPIAALARVDDTNLDFRGMILTPDGTRMYEARRSGHVRDAVALGLDAARDVFKQGGHDVFRSVA